MLVSICLQWDSFSICPVGCILAAAIVAGVSAMVTFGGQTSVIMTDLFQGEYALGYWASRLLFLGINELGEWSIWEHLPRGPDKLFHILNKDASYPVVGIFGMYYTNPR